MNLVAADVSPRYLKRGKASADSRRLLHVSHQPNQVE